MAGPDSRAKGDFEAPEHNIQPKRFMGEPVAETIHLSLALPFASATMPSKFFQPTVEPFLGRPHFKRSILRNLGTDHLSSLR